jgi:hypothetical protein
MMYKKPLTAIIAVLLAVLFAAMSGEAIVPIVIELLLPEAQLP